MNGTAMNYDQIAAFVEVANRRSFSQASRRLHLSQSSVTRQIQALERELGVQLIERSSRRLELTPAGRVFNEFATSALGDHRALLERLRLAGDGDQHQQLCIAASDTPGEFIVPRLLAEFKAKVAGVAPRLAVVPAHEVLYRLQSHHIDVGFVGVRLTAPGVASVAIAEDEIMVAVPPDHPLAARQSVSLASIEDQPLILPGDDSGTMRTLRRTLAVRNLHLAGESSAMVLGSGRAVVDAVRAGYGVGIVSSLAIDEVREGVVGLRVQDIDLRRSIYVIYDEREAVNPRRDQFVLFVQRELQR